MNANAEEIRECLAAAQEHDALAQGLRRQAGQLLARAKADQPQGGQWYRAAGLDERSAELLVALAEQHAETGASAT